MEPTLEVRNFKKEPFIQIDHTLFLKLEEISKQLSNAILDENKRILISKYYETKRNSFHLHWKDLVPNNITNKHAKNEFKGLYAFALIIDNVVNWQYIGISQTIKRRFRGHTILKNKNSATWAYIMSERKEEIIGDIQKSKVFPCYFTFIQIDDNMLLHMAEVYCVNRLRAYWNTFETH